MPLFIVVLSKQRVIIKKQKEKRKTRDEKTREVKVEIKRRLRSILHQTPKVFVLFNFFFQSCEKSRTKGLEHHSSTKYWFICFYIISCFCIKQQEKHFKDYC